MSLLEYWQEYPPVHVLLQGIAAGMGARFGTAAAKSSVKTITSAEELLSTLSGVGGVKIGVRPDGR